MNQDRSDAQELVSLAEAERICREKLGMSAARFLHELAEHVRGSGGIAWVADVDVVGVRRGDLDEFCRRADAGPDRETQDD